MNKKFSEKIFKNYFLDPEKNIPLETFHKIAIEEKKSSPAYSEVYKVTQKNFKICEIKGENSNHNIRHANFLPPIKGSKTRVSLSYETKEHRKDLLQTDTRPYRSKEFVELRVLNDTCNKNKPLMSKVPSDVFYCCTEVDEMPTPTFRNTFRDDFEAFSDRKESKESFVAPSDFDIKNPVYLKINNNPGLKNKNLSQAESLKHLKRPTKRIERFNNIYESLTHSYQCNSQLITALSSVKKKQKIKVLNKGLPKDVFVIQNE